MADLSDFGGGADQDPDPEDQVKIDLSQWFKNHGAEVFWEKRPSYGHRVFRCKTAEKPDLLVRGDRHTFAIEVKIPDGAGDAYSGAEQTFRYWRRYCVEEEDEFYRADGDELEPDAFILGTKYAPDGRLTQRYDTQSNVRPVPIHDKKRLEYFDAPIHFLPDWEFGIAETVTRMLWRFADQRYDDSAHRAAGIGTLLSSRLDGRQPEIPDEDAPGPFERPEMPEPRALYRSFDDEYGGGAKCQNWRGL